MRHFFADDLWAEERTFSKAEAYLDLLQLAAFAPSKRIVSGKLIELDEGECIASTRFLGKRWGWSKNKVATFMDLLEKGRYAGRRTGQGETIVILYRYSDWRSYLPESGTATGTATGTEEGQGRDREGTNNKKGKKMEKGKQGETLCPPPPDALSMFMESLPTDAAKDFDGLFQTMNRLHPSWAKHPHPTYTEKTTALANSKALFAIEPETWAKLAEFYAAIITPDFQATYGKFWRPDNRGKFLESITDVLTSCDRWEAALKDEKRRK